MYNDSLTPNLLYNVGYISQNRTGVSNYYTNFTVPNDGVVYLALLKNDTGVNYLTHDNTGGGSTTLSVSGYSACCAATPNTLTLSVTQTGDRPWASLTYRNPTDPYISLNPINGPKGSSVIIRGFHFTPIISTNIYFDGTLLSQVLSNNGDGTFSKTVIIPNTGTLGSHIINATDQAPTPKTATAVFTITKQIPKITLVPTNQAVGSSVSVSGSGFTNQSPLLFKLDKKVLPTNPALPKTDILGNFTGITFIVPQTTAGNHNINVTDGFNNNATAILNVTSSEQIIPSTGTVGTTVTVNGYGFTASHSINVKFDGTILTTATTNINGTFVNAKIRIPSSTVNSHTILSTDGSHSASQTFTTIPALTLVPNSGSIGNIITLNGSGFLGSSQINVNFGGNIITTNPPFFITNATGSFQNIKITVPGIAVGNYTIQAYDTGSNKGSKIFVVTPFNSNAPNPVSDLHTTFVNNTSLGLAWSQPNLNKNILSGYQINYTTPSGIPNLILTNNTLSSVTSFTVTGLQSNTQYSFRVGVWTTNSSNPYGNILNVQTSTSFIPANFTIGTVGTKGNTNINGSNPLRIPIQYVRTDTGTTTQLNVIYPNSFNLSCTFNYEFAQINRTYNNLPVSQYDANYVQSTFSFNNTSNEVIQVDCMDKNTGTDGRYVLTQSNFPVVQQVNNFRNGTYGTTGTFGALDLILLVAIIISMIGLNRGNESVGAIFTIVIIGVMAFFGIITWPIVVISMVALAVMLAVSQTRKN